VLSPNSGDSLPDARTTSSKLGSMSMLRFYLSLVRDIPRVFRDSYEAWTFWILAIATPVVLAIWPVARPMTDSPCIIAVPVLMSVVYGMLRVNYVRFKAMKDELDGRMSRADIVDKLRHFFRMGQDLACGVLESDDACSVDECTARAERWSDLVTAYLDINVSPISAHAFEGPAQIQIQPIYGMKSVETRHEKTLLLNKVYCRVEGLTAIIKGLEPTFPSLSSKKRAADILRRWK